MKYRPPIHLHPPLRGTCPKCGARHDPALPHDRDSIYYQLRFHRKYGREPTWADAAAHCAEDVRRACVEKARAAGAPEEITG